MTAERISSNEDLLVLMKEKALTSRLREAVGFCKDLLEINANTDYNMK